MHGLAEEGVDAGLVAGAGALEPGQDVGVEAEGDGALDGSVKFSDDSLAPVRYFGDIGRINVLVAKTEKSFEPRIKAFGARIHRFLFPGAWLSGLR